MLTNNNDRDYLLCVLKAVYTWSNAQDFKGYNKHDALNSPLLNAVFGWSKWPRMIAIQSVMRAPVNIRPLLLVKKTYNPKGLALFIKGLVSLYQAKGNPEYLENAKRLIEILELCKSPGNWSGNCWGYHYPWQDAGFFAPAKHPNAVVTCFVCEALLDTFVVTQSEKYLHAVTSALEFLTKDLTVLVNSEKELCLAYTTFPMKMRVMDVSILIASVIARYNALTSNTNSEYEEKCHRLVRYVINQQTEYGAWYYTDPPQDSHITHDNYHTGFILDALARYMEATNNSEYQEHYNNGLTFYAEKLFNHDGAPRWMSDKSYPYDIHGSAQGILTFSRHESEHPGLATRIIEWAMRNMYNPDGRFYYQKTALFPKRFTLLRWCNAWMFHALAEYIKYDSPDK